ncbi:MAG: hypothetical protein H6704_26325 [Myxococcales bacterium]|nr:hypothetical protein [Myxococcales bacterium]
MSPVFAPALLWIVLGASPAAEALRAAEQCYADLEYACAEERLAEALAGDLTDAERQRARLRDALLALAHRDRARARRAVRALLAADPAYDPGPAPPALQTLIAQERPPPAPPPSARAGADFVALPLFGQDADRWSDGLGARASGGVLWQGRWWAEGEVLFSDHLGQAFAVDGLQLWALGVAAGWQAPLGPLRLAVGGGLGAAYVSVDGAVADDSFWGATVQAAVEITWPVAWGLGLGARVAPGLLLRAVDDQAAVTYLLPLTVGLRYGR